MLKELGQLGGRRSVRRSAVLVLGLETSCDETAAALVEDGRRVLSDVVSTQVDIHRRWGGVVPELASRNHVVQVMPVLARGAHPRRARRWTTSTSSPSPPGPGLIGALLVGVQVAKSLSLATRHARSWASNHLEGHLLAIRLLDDRARAAVPRAGRLRRPHQPLRGAGLRRLPAASAAPATTPRARPTTRSARILGLPYPGGLPIDQLAQKGDPKAIRFPRALPQRGPTSTGPSPGLKTAVLHHVRKHGVPEGQALADLCASFQEAVADALSRRSSSRAARRLGLKQLVVCGGRGGQLAAARARQERADERG